MVKKKKKLHKKLSGFLEKGEFDFGEKVIEILKLIIVCLSYSTGIPIFYLFISLGLMVVFWVHKYTLMRFSKVPQPLNGKFIKSLFVYLKIGLILHLIFGIYFLGDEHIFPTMLHFDIHTLHPVQEHISFIV